MNEPKVEISTDQKEWGSSVKFIKNQQVVIYYRITSCDINSIKILVPVIGLDTITDANGIMTEEGWKNLKISIVKKADDPDDFTVEKERTPGKTGVNIVIFTDEPCIFSMAFKIANNSLTTDFGYEYKDGSTLMPKPVPGQFSIVISNEPVCPTITRYTTTSAALLTNEEYKLSWEVADADNLYIIDGGANKQDADPNKMYHPSSGEKEVTLLATSGKKDNPAFSAKKTITILGLERTGINPVPEPFNGGMLLNLIKKDEQTMYGLVMNKDTGVIWLWETNDGVIWTNKEIAFNDKIPAVAAGSSGIYYNGNIYLIAGSRFDPNEKSSSVYYLNFTNRQWQEIPNTVFTERMGQAVVIVKDKPEDVGDIYMLGGYGPEGTLNEIFTFNIADGWKRVFNMSQPLCMHTAVFKDRQLQIFGGSTDGPSNANQRMKDAVGSAILSNDKSWKSLGFEDSQMVEALKYNIVSCAMDKCKSDTFFFGVYQLGKFFLNVISQIEGSKLTSVLSGKFLESEYCSSLQVIDFKRAIWLCNVYNNNALTSSGLRYFLFQPTKPSAP